MRRSEAIKQILPYLEIVQGHITVGDRPHGMPRKVFSPMARKLSRMSEELLRAQFGPEIPSALESHVALGVADLPAFNTTTLGIPCTHEMLYEPDAKEGFFVAQCANCFLYGPARKTAHGATQALKKGLTK